MTSLLLLGLLIACGKSDNGADCKYGPDCKSGKCVRERCESGEVGASCEKNFQCDSKNDINCINNTCRGPGDTGEPCSDLAECKTGLRCHAGSCLDDDAIRKATEAQVAEKRRIAAEKERKLLEQAGVTPTIEAAVSPPGPGTRVRIVTITAKDTVFAACRPDERLTGGGCNTGNLHATYPSGHGVEDTIGARWNCVGDAAAEVTAYALCTKP